VRRDVRNGTRSEKRNGVCHQSAVAAGRMPAPRRADFQSAEMAEMKPDPRSGTVSATDWPLLRAECPRPGAGLQSAEMSEMKPDPRNGTVSATDRPLLRAERPRPGARTSSPQRCPK